MLRLPGVGQPGARAGVRWMSLLIVLGVAGMHGLGLLAGCGGGHADAQATSAGHASAAVEQPHTAGALPAAKVGHAAVAAVRADGASAITVEASGHGGCHVLHLCLAVLAGLTLVLLLGAVTWAGPVSSSLAGVLRAAVQARGPPRPRWGPVELCVSRT